ncbi:MAG: adenylate/guanylate cyclase domain-containing protein [Deltaproteobacteria bacterium]|jgi:adenylate cyclase|nr:adenylate/guanylate cyclase domain-containing protein [Deltaproteobacteria bacterium]
MIPQYFSNRFGSSFSKYYKKWYSGFVCAVLITLLVVLLQRFSFMQILEAKTLDVRFSTIEPPETASIDVVLVGIDDSSLKYFADNNISWPWPRNFYAHLLDYLTKSGAKSVIFDLLFYQHDIDRSESDGTETDNIFANAIQKNGNVILASQLTHEDLGSYFDPSRFYLDINKNADVTLPQFNGILAPIDSLLHETHHLGIVNVEPDSDGIIRRVPLIYPFSDRFLPQIAVSAFLSSQKMPVDLQLTSKHMEIGETHVPLDNTGNYLIHWYGRKDTCQFIKCIPISAVIQSASAIQTGVTPQFLPDIFKDKFVIIGATAGGLMDLKSTPVSEIQPGMEIWATILLNLIRKDFIQHSSLFLNASQVLIVSFIIFMFITRIHSIASHFLVLFIAVIIGVETFCAWRFYKLALNFTMPMSGLIFSYLTHTSLGFFVEGQAKRKISKAMARYLHPDLVQQIAQDPEQVKMGGQEVEATVMFSDIYDFTTISESFTPHELVAHLNSYFSDISNFILDHGGMLDKYTGDGIMAIFGAPLPRNDHALLACRAALAHKDFSIKLGSGNHFSVSDQFHSLTRLGIHSGKIVAGNIGSSRRMDYTAIGDTVNLSARLEGVNKIYKTKIIISNATFELIKNEFICRELDFLRVKGKKTPTRIYELIAHRNLADKDAYQWIEKYHTALNAYRQGNWENAGTLFEALATEIDNDPPSLVMAERCRYLIENPPKHWDGILKLEVK